MICNFATNEVHSLAGSLSTSEKTKPLDISLYERFDK